MTQIFISTFEPQVVSFDVIAHEHLLRVHVDSILLKDALGVFDSSVDLGTAIEQHIEPIRDVAWAQYDKTHSVNIVLSAEELKPVSAWADRTGPPPVDPVPVAGV